MSRLLLLIMLPPLLAGPVLADEAAQFAARNDLVRSRLQGIKDEIQRTEEARIPDTVFQYNTGLSMASDQAKAIFGEGPSLDGLLSDHIADVEQSLKGQTKLANRRQQVLDSTRRKHQAYERMGDQLRRDEAKIAARLEQIGDQRLAAKGLQQRRLQQELKQQAGSLTGAQASRKQLQRRKNAIGLSKKTAQLSELQKDINQTRARLEKWKVAQARKQLFDSHSFLVGAALTAISSEMEENALAARENRRPLLTNKLVNFAKNVSGYSTVMGVVENVDAARMQSMVDTAEFYERNGFDLTDPRVRAGIEASARRAVCRAALYEGAKLAPVVGDLINLKETTDVLIEDTVAIEEAGYVQANNEQAQFQTSLRTAVNVEAKVRQMEAAAEQARLLMTTLGRLKEQLLAMQQAAATNREQLGQALKVIAAYNEQAAALGNPAVAASLAPANLDALLARLSAAKTTADEQTGNMQRVKTEHQAGQLTAQGVATQARFIGDLLQPAVADHAALQPTLAAIEALSRGAELAAEVPVALDFVRQSKPVMQQQGQLAAQLYATYRDQADSLEQLARRFQELRGEMPKYLKHLETSKNLEDPHQDKIRAALDRANRADIDQTALRRAIDDARGLRSSSEMVSALADLDKAPQAVDTAQLDALVQQAQQAWVKLEGPSQATADSLRNARELLDGLVALAGDAQPIEVAEKTTTALSSDLTLQGKLFAGQSALDISPEAFQQALLNRTADGTFAHQDFFGFSAYDFPPNAKPWEYCKNVREAYCPRENKLYRLLDTGETQREWRGQNARAPFWIASLITDFDADLTLGPRWVRNLEDALYLTSDLKNAESHKDSTSIVPISLPHADEALVYSRQHGDFKSVNLLARKDQLIMRASGTIECWTGPLEGEAEPSQMHPRVRDPEPWEVERFGQDLTTRCAQWYDQQADVLATLLDPLLNEATPLMQKMRDSLYFQPIDFDFGFQGLMPGERNGVNRQLNDKSSATGRFTHEWQVAVGKRTDRFFENYNFQVSWRNDVHYTSTLQAIFDRIDQIVNKSANDYLKHPSIERREVKVSLPGAETVRMVRSNSLWNRKTDGYRAAQISEHLYFRIANVWVKVECSATLPTDHPETRTLEIARAIAEKIRKAPKGW